MTLFIKATKYSTLISETYKMDKSTVVLRSDTDLRGKDLTLVYRHFQACKDLPENPARFKKKEALETMAKSILKHRIQTL